MNSVLKQELWEFRKFTEIEEGQTDRHIYKQTDTQLHWVSPIFIVEGQSL